MSVTQKYLKDENGEIFSPIVNVNSIYGENGEKLSSFIYQRKLLWESSEDYTVFQAGSTFSLTDIPDNYDLLEFRTIYINRGQDWYSTFSPVYHKRRF